MRVRLAPCPSPDSTDSYLFNCFHLVSWCNCHQWELWRGAQMRNSSQSWLFVYHLSPCVMHPIYLCWFIYALCASGRGSAKSARICRLVWTLAGRIPNGQIPYLILKSFNIPSTVNHRRVLVLNEIPTVCTHMNEQYLHSKCGMCFSL